MVVIDSIEHATFYALLEFLYTGTLDHTCSNRQGSREEKTYQQHTFTRSQAKSSCKRMASSTCCR